MFDLDTFATDYRLGNGMADGRRNAPRHTRIYPTGDMPAVDLIEHLKSTGRLVETPIVRTAEQIEAEALRIEDFKFSIAPNSHLAVRYIDHGSESTAACYSEESATAMVKAFGGVIVK